MRLTAVLLGLPARKDMAAAFRRVNPNTSFDVARADKWLHGRAKPRDPKVYEDWAKLLDLDRGGPWLAECAFEELLAESAAHHGRDPAELLERLEGQGGRGPTVEAPGLSLAGTYATYSHAWSPYFRGRLIRAEMAIGAAARTGARSAPRQTEHPTVSYTEILPTGPLRLDGTIAADKRALRIEVCDETQISQYLNFSLFPPSPPVSVLAGLMFGTTLIGPDAQPSTTRVVMVRLPADSARLRSAEAYLPEGGTIADDLASLGLPVDTSAPLERALRAFMEGGSGGGFDQVPATSYRDLLEQFDRLWLTRGTAGQASTAPVSPRR